MIPAELSYIKHSQTGLGSDVRKYLQTEGLGTNDVLPREPKMWNPEAGFLWGVFQLARRLDKHGKIIEPLYSETMDQTTENDDRTLYQKTKDYVLEKMAGIPASTYIQMESIARGSNMPEAHQLADRILYERQRREEQTEKYLKNLPRMTVGYAALTSMLTMSGSGLGKIGHLIPPGGTLIAELTARTRAIQSTAMNLTLRDTYAGSPVYKEFIQLFSNDPNNSEADEIMQSPDELLTLYNKLNEQFMRLAVPLGALVGAAAQDIYTGSYGTATMSVAGTIALLRTFHRFTEKKQKEIMERFTTMKTEAIQHAHNAHEDPSQADFHIGKIHEISEKIAGILYGHNLSAERMDSVWQWVIQSIYQIGNALQKQEGMSLSPFLAAQRIGQAKQSEITAFAPTKQAQSTLQARHQKYNTTVGRIAKLENDRRQIGPDIHANTVTEAVTKRFSLQDDNILHVTAYVDKLGIYRELPNLAVAPGLEVVLGGIGSGKSSLLFDMKRWCAETGIEYSHESIDKLAPAFKGGAGLHISRMLAENKADRMEEYITDILLNQQRRIILHNEMRQKYDEYTLKSTLTQLAKNISTKASEQWQVWKESYKEGGAQTIESDIIDLAVRDYLYNEVDIPFYRPGNTPDNQVTINPLRNSVSTGQEVRIKLACAFMNSKSKIILLDEVLTSGLDDGTKSLAVDYLIQNLNIDNSRHVILATNDELLVLNALAHRLPQDIRAGVTRLQTDGIQRWELTRQEKQDKKGEITIDETSDALRLQYELSLLSQIEIALNKPFSPLSFHKDLSNLLDIISESPDLSTESTISDERFTVVFSRIADIVRSRPEGDYEDLFILSQQITHITYKFHKTKSPLQLKAYQMQEEITPPEPPESDE